MAEENAVRKLIEALGDSLVEGRIGFDEEGRAAFEAADGLVVGIDHLPNTNQLLLHAELGRLPEDEPAAADLRRDLLHESLELAATLGGALAVDRETGTVALFARRGAAGLGFEAFEAWVGDVAEAAQIWAERLAPGA